MNQDMLYKYLDNLSPAEQFYQMYQKMKEDPEQFRRFLATLTPEALSSEGYLIPEFQTKEPVVLQLNHAETTANCRSVRLVKLSRYMPPFLHSHDFFEIIYILRGSCEHKFGHQTQTLSTGDLCMISPAFQHSISTGSCLALDLMVHPYTIENLLSNSLPGKDPISDFLRNGVFLKNFSSQLTLHTGGDEETSSQIFDMFIEEFQSDEYADPILNHMMIIFLIRLTRKYKKTAESLVTTRTAPIDTARILRYMLENYATASLGELAQILNYSVPYCSKYIKSYLGQSFSQLQKQIRFQKATNYLINTDLSVDKISERIGYANPENFMRTFKKEFGVSPTRYRLINRGGI